MQNQEWQKEIKHFYGHNYETVLDWINAHIGELGHDRYTGHIGVIFKYQIGERRNGVWFTFKDRIDGQEYNQYKRIPKCYEFNKR